MAGFFGVLFGIITGLIICLILYRFANYDKKIKSVYDERQEAIRNVAYKYAFYTVLAYEAVMLAAGIGRIELPLPSYAVHFLGIIIGCCVLGVYCILKDVFWGMNNNHRRYFVILAVAAVLNAVPVAAALTRGSLFTEGLMDVPVINIMVLFMLLVLLIAMIIKKASDSCIEKAEDVE